MREITSFDDFVRVMFWGSRGIDILLGPKNMDYSSRKQPEMPEIKKTKPLQSCIGGPGASKSPGTQKPWTIAHENGQKCPKSRLLTMPLESCTGGHRAWKSTWDPKIVDYRPRKWPEMREIMSFNDAARVMFRGSQGMEILPGPKNRGLQPTETARNARSHEI